MWNRVLRISEWLVNLGSLCLLIYVSLALVKPPKNSFRFPSRAVALRPGQTVPISGVDWARNRHTLVLALQTGCHFCAESAPFYKQLLQARKAENWQAIAVLPQAVKTSMAYMRTEGYAVPDVRQMNLGALGVSGTPTLLLVDQNGKLETEWVGKLDAADENEVAAALGLGKIAEVEPHVIVAGMGLGVDSSEQSELEVGSVSSVLEPDQEQSPTDTSGMKKVTLGYYRAAPARVVQILEGSVDVTPAGRDPLGRVVYKPWTGKPFQAGDDWMKNLVFVVKNLSPKEITAIDMNLIFPQTGSGTVSSPVSGYTVMVGRKPAHALFNSRTGLKHTPSGAELEPLNIQTGQEARIALAPFYDRIKALIEDNRPISTVAICQIASTVFYFVDGTRWQGGMFEKPDPSKPGEYTPITREEWTEAGN